MKSLRKMSRRRFLHLVALTFLVLCLSWSALTDGAESEPAEAWVRRYNGPAQDLDYATAMAMDAQGNIYVTGKSKGADSFDDYATVKYSPSGRQLWVSRYEGWGNDQAVAVATDLQGNVYVTGTSGASGQAAYATIKYNAATGQEIWVRRYDGPNNNSNAKAMAVDGDGNVYVTGSTFIGMINYHEDWDIVTVKYSPGGQEVWTRIYKGGNYADEAAAIAVDGQGNVYVAGVSRGYGYAIDPVTIKYSSAGTEEWVQRYNTGPGGEAEAHAIATDSQGNVYVAGYVYTTPNTREFLTLKYSSSGEKLWDRNYTGGSTYNRATAIAVDQQGNVCVTGSSAGSDLSIDYATVKYDSQGHQLWAQRYNPAQGGFDGAVAIAVDSQSNVYVTGNSMVSLNFDDYATLKYSPAGQQLWVKRYNGGFDSNSPTALAVDAKGNVYVTGGSGNRGNVATYDYATVKYGEPNAGTVPLGLLLMD